MADYGYAGSILIVDISEGTHETRPSAPYTSRFIGGHGVASRLYWELAPPAAKAFDPENVIVAASGPVAGFPGFAGARWKMVSRTTLNVPESFNYCNLGERWGSFLKFAGYDALAVKGRADKPVYIYINNDTVEIRDASRLKGLSTFDTADAIQKEAGDAASVLAIGPAGENLVPFAVVQSEGASGSGGMGAVMGAKNLKAIAVAGNRRPTAARPERLRELIKIIKDNKAGSTMPSMWADPQKVKAHAHNCYGCGIGCYRELYTVDGRQYKSLCQQSMIYEHFLKMPRKDAIELLGSRLCDGYGMDTSVIQSMIEFLDFCYKAGVINECQTGLPLSRIGSTEFSEKFMRMVAFREGFGEVLAKGIIAAAEEIGPGAVEQVPKVVATRGSEKKDYDPRLLITTAITYATEPRRAIQQLHEVSFFSMMWHGMGPGAKPGSMFSSEDFRKIASILWGSEIAADFSTYEGKAMAARKIQDRVFFKESMVLCDLRWTMSQIPRVLGTGPDNVTEEQVYTAVTGKEIDREQVWHTGERIFNLQRAILLRQGWGGRDGDTLLDYFHTVPFQKNELFFNADGMMPGKDGQPVSKVGATVERDKFEALKTEYYGYRGWDPATGYPTRSRLEELDLKDIADDLEARGLLG